MKDRRHTEQLGRLLLRALACADGRRSGGLDGLDEPTIGELTRLANHHRVPGLVYRSLQDAGVPDDTLGELRRAYQMAALAHSRSLLELESVDSALSGTGSPWMVVKGPVLTQLGYGDPGARLFEDLDLLVGARSLSASIGALEEVGGRVVDVDWAKVSGSRRSEMAMVLANGLLCDLHWHLLVTPDQRARFALSMEEVVDRRRRMRLGGVEVDTLDAVDGLLYLCLHASLSGGHQLVWVTDVDRMASRETLDWDELVRRARRYRADLVAAIQLERARLLLGTDVPAEVIETLAANRAWWRLWQARERRAGAARWGGYDRTDRILVAATSGGTARSAVQLARLLGTTVVRPKLSRSGARAGNGRSPEPPARAPRTGRAPTGDVTRAAFVGSVESGRWR